MGANLLDRNKLLEILVAFIRYLGKDLGYDWK